MHTKLPKVGTTIFTVMSQLAAEHGAVNLGQGFPDFPVPARLVSCPAFGGPDLGALREREAQA